MFFRHLLKGCRKEKTIGNIIEETIQAMGFRGMPYKVIVVDDGLTGNTKQIASRYKATYYQWKSLVNI